MVSSDSTDWDWLSHSMSAILPLLYPAQITASGVLAETSE